MERKKTRIFFNIFVATLLFILTACSSGPPITVTHPHTVTIPASRQFKAGAAETDITPPPGLPLFGYAIGSEARAPGYWTRLKSRAIVFENPDGSRFALVQLDLGAVSRLIYREVAKRLANEGFRPGDLLITGSHSHAGPGGFFSETFYNKFGSGRGGFFYQLVEWMADRVADSVKKACHRLAPAQVGVDSIIVKNLSRNRSLEAWSENFSPGSPPPYKKGIIPRVFVIRVDHTQPVGSHATTPIAAFVIVPAHDTVIGTSNKYYHGDFFGAASRILAKKLQEHYKLVTPPLVAVAPGPQGDVSPKSCKRDQKETVALGTLLATHAKDIFLELDDQLQAAPFKKAYKEERVPDANTENGKLCLRPRVGSAMLGGAEDGRSVLFKLCGNYEGKKARKPQGCQTYKKPVLGFIHNLIFKKKSMPALAPMQVVQLADLITLATLPAEPTTETGRRIVEAISPEAGTEYTALVAMANGYMSYVATTEEYNAHHFEGAFTLYGPHEAQFFQEQLLDLTRKCAASHEQEVTQESTFRPGTSESIFYKNLRPCSPEKWKFKKLKSYIDKKGKKKVRIFWRGLREKRYIKNLPTIKVVIPCNNASTPQRVVDTDHGLNFLVVKGKKDIWTATWTPNPEIEPTGPFRIKISRPGMPPLVSKEFHLPKR